MDSVTQIALGAAVGEAVLGKKAGNKAILWGAVAGTIPDLDVLVGKLLSPMDELLFHRSISHSFLFALLMSPLLGWLVWRLYKKDLATKWEWSSLFFLGFVTHALLDSFTTWGTQLFWPHPYRVSIKSIFVIDPLYTIPLLVCLIWLMFLNRRDPRRRRLNWWGIGLSSAYLLFTVVNKTFINQIFESEFARQNLPVREYNTKPAPLTTILWTANAETTDGYYIGYYSWLDEDKKVQFQFFQKKHELLEPYLQNDEVQKLLNITEGWYTVEKTTTGLVVNDLRFGQHTGWIDKPQNFVFSYNINVHPNGQVDVVPRENSMKEARKMVGLLFQRIAGES